MKTGQMLFVAFGGVMLGAAGTLAIQTGLVHYEVTLDIRPRGTVTLPPPTLSAASDPYPNGLPPKDPQTKYGLFSLWFTTKQVSSCSYTLQKVAAARPISRKP